MIEYDLKFLLAVLNWATVAGDARGGVLLERNPTLISDRESSRGDRSTTRAGLHIKTPLTASPVEVSSARRRAEARIGDGWVFLTRSIPRGHSRGIS